MQYQHNSNYSLYQIWFKVFKLLLLINFCIDYNLCFYKQNKKNYFVLIRTRLVDIFTKALVLVSSNCKVAKSEESDTEILINVVCFNVKCHAWVILTPMDLNYGNYAEQNFNSEKSVFRYSRKWRTWIIISLLFGQNSVQNSTNVLAIINIAEIFLHLYNLH